MFDTPKLYISACSNSCQLVPLHPIVMSILHLHYKELKECISKVVRIERRDDRHSISSKFSDFTVETINRLIDEGENDAIKALSAPAS